jgi:hypothetical protein
MKVERRAPGPAYANLQWRCYGAGVGEDIASVDVDVNRWRATPPVKKMKLLKGDSFPIFLVSDGVSQQSCRGHLSKEVAGSSGCRRSVQRFRCSMAVFELLARATGAWVVAAGNGHLVNRSSRIADGVPRRSAAGKPVRMDVAGGWRYQVNQYLMSRVGVLVSLD